MRWAGIHAANGPQNWDRVLGMPATLYLVCSPEARWHWQRIRQQRRDATFVWRDIPLPEERPARIRYSPSRAVDAFMARWDQQPHGPGEWALSHNELDLRDERGDNADDWSDLAARYDRLAAFLADVGQELRRALPAGTSLVFPAWTPDHGALDHLDRWSYAAEDYDAIAVHSYGSTETIAAQVNAYCAAFQEHDVMLLEWNSAGLGVDEDRRTLQWLADNDVPATYFCWHWFNPTVEAHTIDDTPERLALFKDPPVAGFPPPIDAPPPEEVPPMTEYEAFLRSEAARRGIDPDVAVRAANTEGGLTEPARRGTFGTGSSWWAFQLHYGGAGYEYLGTVAGMGNTFTAVTGWAPGDPAAWRDAMRFALDEIRRGGWGPWYGPKNIGITGFVGVDQSVRWGGTPDAEWDYRQAAPPPPRPMPVFDPDWPAIAQTDNWSCAPTSARWALWSIGRRPTEAWIEGAVIAQNVANPQVGLTDGSGAGLAEFLNREYANEPGPVVRAGSAMPIAFDDVASAAGHHPQLVGSSRWGSEGHWSGVRGYDAASDSLLLANPASGYDGITQTMSRAQWEARTPWACVWIEAVPKTGDAPAPEPLPDDLALFALKIQLNDALGREVEYQRQVTALREQLERANGSLGQVTVDLADQIQVVLDQIRARKPAA